MKAFMFLACAALLLALAWETAAEDVTCHPEAEVCESGQCCGEKCCDFDKGTCCESGTHCCPKAYDCVENNMCKPKKLLGGGLAQAFPATEMF